MALVHLGLSYADFLSLTPAEILEMHQHHRQIQDLRNDFELNQTRLIITALYNTAGKMSRKEWKPEEILKLKSEMKAPVKPVSWTELKAKIDLWDERKRRSNN